MIANGDGFADPFVGGPSAEHGPLTPLLLAAVSWMEDPVPWQRTVMTVLGVVTVVWLIALARRLAGWSAAVATGWIAALYPNLWINDGLVMSESLGIVLVVAVVWFALDVVDGVPGWWRAGACGLALGLGALARSELVLLVPIVVVIVAVYGRRSRRRVASQVAVLVAVTSVVLLAWVGPNLVRFDRPVVLTTNEGPTLLGANCADSYSGSGTGGWSLFCVLDAGGLPGEDSSVRSDRQRRMAARYAVDHVGRVPMVVAARIGRMVDVVGVPDMVNGDVGEERPAWASWTGVACFWVLAVLAAFGFARLRPPARWVLLAPVVSVLVTAIAFYGAHRIRAPAEPVIVVAAGITAGGLASRWARARRPA